MFQALALSTFLVAACIAIHYEMLRYTSVLIPSLKVAVRIKVLLVVLGCFIAHTIEVWLYAFAYLLLDQIGLGSLQGQTEEHFADFLYFSATSYSTLGIGDVYPTGVFRLISGIESINGLFLIAWSTSFTYFVMNRLWPLHSDRTNEDGSD
ncbi:MAG: ion channel [Nitrobacter sp.]